LAYNTALAINGSGGSRRLRVRGLLILDRTSDGRSGLIGRTLCSCKSLQFVKLKMMSKGVLIFASKI
jgi:hypothetical protein